MSDDQIRGNDAAGSDGSDPTSPLPTTPPPAAGDQTSIAATGAGTHTPWYRRRGAPTAIAAFLAFLLGIGVGASGGESESAQDEFVALTANVSDLEVQVEDYEVEITELEEELSEASAELEAAPDVADLEEQLEEAEAALADAEIRAETSEEQQARAAELDEREERLDSQQDAVPSEAATESETGAEFGCSSGQVDINSAGSEQLQRIHQVGPDRAGQIASLRPFSSVDGLTRVSGIGPSHLEAIKGQGLACVP